MGNRDKKKKDRKNRLERYRSQNSLPKVTAKDKTFGKVALWVMGGMIVLSAIFFFANMK